MDLGIVGLPRSGKTTLFNAVTRGAAQTATFSSGTKPNIGVAKVPDPRLQLLTDMFVSKSTVAAEVTYVDIPPAPEGLGQTRGISGEYLNHLQRADALVIVVRAFEDPSVADDGRGVDPYRDVETMLYELTFADLEILDRKLARLSDGKKSAKTADRQNIEREEDLILRLKQGLEDGTPIGGQTLLPDERRLIEGYQFLTAKPIIVVANAGEDQLGDLPSIEERLASDFGSEWTLTAAVCGQLEMELAQMDAEDEKEFRESMGAGESGLARMLWLTYQALDQITFFTGSETEVRAWIVERDAPASRAAGRIHSDLERGFIRAEVVTCDNLLKCGSYAEAKKLGLLRQEGKTYPVKEGDVLTILFNV